MTGSWRDGLLIRARFTAQFVLPEMIAHAFMTACFLLTFQVIAFLLNAPLLAYNVNKCVSAAISCRDTLDVHSWLRHLARHFFFRSGS